MKRIVICSILSVLVTHNARTASMNDMDHGPFVSWTIRGEGKSVTYKGIAIKVDAQASAAVCFDTDLLRFSAAWTAGFLEWYPERDGLERNPTIDGILHYTNDSAPGWSPTGQFDDPRPLPYGPVPDSWAHYNGLYRHGDKTVLSYSVGGCDILELPDFERIRDQPFFTRTLNLEATQDSLSLRLLKFQGADPDPKHKSITAPTGVLRLRSESKNRLIGYAGLPKESEWKIEDAHVCLKLPPLTKKTRLKLYISNEPRIGIRDLTAALKTSAENDMPIDLTELTNGGPSLWPTTLETEVVPGRDRDALAVDRLSVPEKNPWNSWIRFGGIDFLDRDQAILGSVSGDVWLVAGLPQGSDKLTWKRFATGLYQPLGVKIIDGEIFVLGRDQVTRLHDRNNDGEADFYENFNNDAMVAENFHAFTLNLETDSSGNFYYAQGAPWPPDVKTPHQGILLRLSKDGKTLESFADGLRGPNGMAVGPNDMITFSDNEGHWLPTCTLQLVRKGGFHGMEPTAHMHEGIPPNFEPPICWIPHDIDNSPGDQVWLTGDHWGPLAGKMVLSSYGKSSLALVLMEEVNGSVQGGTVLLPLRFRSGLIRGRQNSFDGHLYVCGLTVWQSTGIRPGEFYRVRYTGQPLNMPIELNAQSNGIKLTFSDPLDPEFASDPQDYSIEQWNYRWIERYGSPHYSVKNPDQEGHDEVGIKAIKLSNDNRTVLLETTQKIQPVMQMKIAYNIRSANRSRLRHEIYNTIHQVRK